MTPLPLGPCCAQAAAERNPQGWNAPGGHFHSTWLGVYHRNCSGVFSYFPPSYSQMVIWQETLCVQPLSWILCFGKWVEHRFSLGIKSLDVIQLKITIRSETLTASDVIAWPRCSSDGAVNRPALHLPKPLGWSQPTILADKLASPLSICFCWGHPASHLRCFSPYRLLT